MLQKTLLHALIAVCLLVCTGGMMAQAPAAPKIDFPAPSPTATLKQRVGLTDIEIVYSRPGAKSRQVFGGLVPYGKVWRTGANLATKVSFSTPVKVGGISIPAGSYALFTIPDQKEWTVIINKVTGPWASYAYDDKNDLVRVKASVVALSVPVETFTIDLNDLRNETATLNLEWEKTRVTVPLQVDVAAALVPQIEAAMASGVKLPDGMYFNAASFYYDQGLDLAKAKDWIVRATDNPKPAFFMLHTKAKILAKLGEKEAAIAAAKQSTELAIAAEGAQSGFVKMNNDLIASLR
jgi:hypothetical protein